jgi:NADP-reducing hydrogenase subunit HndB
MAKLTIDDLKKIREKALPTLCLASCTARAKITLHMGTCGVAAGAGPVMDALREELQAAGRDDVRVVVSACAGMCSSEPNVTVELQGSDPVVYQHMDAGKMRQVFRRHVLRGEVQTEFALMRQAAFAPPGSPK